MSYYSIAGDNVSTSSRASRRMMRDADLNVDNSRYGPVWDDPPASCACCVCCGASTTSALVRLFAAIFAMASTAFLVAGMIIKNATFKCGGAATLEFALWEVKGSSFGKVSAYSDVYVLVSRILFIVGGAIGALGCLLVVASVFVVCCFCIQRRREDIYTLEGRHEEAERQRRDRGVSLAALFMTLIAAVVEIPAVVIMGVWYATKMPKLTNPSSTTTANSYRTVIASCAGSKDNHFELGYWFLVVGTGCALVTAFFVAIDTCVKPNPKPERGNYRDTTGLSRSGSFVSTGSSMSSGSAISSNRGRTPSQRRGTVAAPMYAGPPRGANPLYDPKYQQGSFRGPPSRGPSQPPSRNGSMRYYQ